MLYYYVPYIDCHNSLHKKTLLLHYRVSKKTCPTQIVKRLKTLNTRVVIDIFLYCPLHGHELIPIADQQKNELISMKNAQVMAN